jgi:hypothetical protein
VRRIALGLSALALAAGISACGGGDGSQNWYAVGQSDAAFARKTANLNTTYDGTTAESASAWCADIMFLPQPASFKAKLLAHVPAPGQESRQFAAGCEAGAPEFSKASASAPSASTTSPVSKGGSSRGSSSGGSSGSSADVGSNGSSGGATAPGFGTTGLPAADAPEYTDGWNAAKGVTEVDVMAAAGQQMPTTDALSLLDANYCTNNDPNGPGGDVYYGGTHLAGSPWFVGCLSELVAYPPASPVITPSSPGYSVGYALAQQNAAAPANDSMTAQDWCDEYADSGWEYAPTVAGVGTDVNPADDPAVVGCIAGMQSQGVQ